jgi:hypothetical protein
MNNQANNLSIEDLIKALEHLKALGITSVDAIVYTEYDLAFKPSIEQFIEEENIFIDWRDLDPRYLT